MEFYSLLKDENKSTAILSQLNDYPYFHYCLTAFIGKIQDFSKLGTAIDTHEKKVEMQLFRLYRARNKIVHRADQIDNLDMLCANLEHYLRICLNSMIDLMVSVNSIRTPEESFLRYHRLMRKAKLELYPPLAKQLGEKRQKAITNYNSQTNPGSDITLIKLITFHSA